VTLAAGTKATALLFETPVSWNADLVIRRHEPKVRPPPPARPVSVAISKKESITEKAPEAKQAVPTAPTPTTPAPATPATTATPTAQEHPVPSPRPEVHVQPPPAAETKAPEQKETAAPVMSAARIKAMANAGGHKGPSLADVVTAQLSAQITHAAEPEPPKPAPRRKKPEPDAHVGVQEELPPPVKLPGLAELSQASTTDADGARKPPPVATGARSGPVRLPQKPAPSVSQ
jgi:hypothetical protein